MITVVIPSIPPRVVQLARALASVEAQTLPPASTMVDVDHDRTGAMATRNRALWKVETEWVAFLDDDDEFLPQHLQECAAWAEQTGADLVYPWFVQPERHWDDLRAFGVPFHRLAGQLRVRNWIPITVLVRTDLLRSAGGFQYPSQRARFNDSEDWGAWQALHRAGANFQHLPKRTWVWHHWDGHTRGRPDRW